MAEATDRLMSDERWTQMYQLATTNALYQLNSNFDGYQLKLAVQQILGSFNNTQVWPTWTLGSEDQGRIWSKFDRLSVGLQVVQLLLPGTFAIYYGEEIQMKNHLSIRFEETVDNVAKDAGPQNYTKVSRDPFRTPMQWNSSRHAGFTSANTPWLPVNFNDPNAVSQMSKPSSLWNTIKELNALRKSSVALLNGTIDYPLVDKDLFTFTRTHTNDNNGYLIVWNIGSQRKRLTFENITYISNEMTVVRKIKPEGSRLETSKVRKNDVYVDEREISVFSWSTR